MWMQKYWDAFALLFTKIWIVTDPEYASMPQVFHLDDYDRCMLQGTDALYCSISLQLYPKNPENVSDVWKVIQKVSTPGTYYRHDLLRHGICVNQRCPHIPKSELLKSNIHYIKKLSDCYSANFGGIGLGGEIQAIRCQINDLYSIDFYDYLFAIVTLTIIALVLIASFYDTFHKEKPSNTNFSRFISSCSMIQNWKRLTTIDMTHPDAKALSSLQGIRFYNVVAVIIGHTWNVNMAVSILNPRYMEALRDRKLDQFWGLGSRYVTTQTFFMVSVWLLTYRVYKDMEGKKVSLSYLLRRIISRYIRLTPLMAVVILAGTTWMPHIANGPLWDLIIGTQYNLCRRNWWINLAYINNFFPFHEMCANHLWYLAIDMQFHALTLLILWFIWNHPKRASVILGGILVIHVVDTFMKSLRLAYKEITPENTYNTTLVNMESTMDLLKATTTNLPAVPAGIIFGRIFYKYRNTKLLTKKIHVISWWIICVTTTIGTTVFPGIMINVFHQNYVLYTLYICLSRTVYIFGSGLFILGMTQGHGGIIKKACDWPPVYILGRLTFGAYLIHPFLQRLKVGLLRTPNFLNDYILVFDSLGYITWSFLVSVPLALFFEMPFEEMKINVYKAIKKSKRGTQKSD